VGAAGTRPDIVFTIVSWVVGSRASRLHPCGRDKPCHRYTLHSTRRSRTCSQFGFQLSGQFAADGNRRGFPSFGEVDTRRFPTESPMRGWWHCERSGLLPERSRLGLVKHILAGLCLVPLDAFFFFRSQMESFACD